MTIIKIYSLGHIFSVRSTVADPFPEKTMPLVVFTRCNLWFRFKQPGEPIGNPLTKTRTFVTIIRQTTDRITRIEIWFRNRAHRTVVELVKLHQIESTETSSLTHRSGTGFQWFQRWTPVSGKGFGTIVHYAPGKSSIGSDRVIKLLQENDRNFTHS